MAANQEVLRSFLVSLGFQIDTPGVKKFTNTLLGLNSTASTVSKAIVGVAAAAEAMVVSFSHNMEKLYYSSQRTKSSVGNIQALQYAFKQIGLSGDDAVRSLEALASQVRMNPGLRGLMDRLVGHKTEGMDQATALVEMVEKLGKMPHYVGARFAAMFGMDEATFLMMIQKLPELKKSMEDRNKLLKQSGVDADEAAKASMEYQNSMRQIWERVDILTDQLSVKLLPAFKELNQWALELIDSFTGVAKSDIDVKIGGVKAALHAVNEEFKIAEGIKAFFWVMEVGAKNAGTAIYHMGKALLALKHGRLSEFNEEDNKALGALFESPEDRDERERKGLEYGENPKGSPKQEVRGKIRHAGEAAKAVLGGAKDLFSSLENKYGLPAGLLDKMWNEESGRGKNMFSPKGALGHFQFMPDTAKQYGVDNPMDLKQAATGAARFMNDMLRKYNGDLPSALAAYNWGPGNLDKYGLGMAPSETRGYVKDITGKPITIQQKTEINVNGAGDPSTTASEIARQQGRVNGDLVRNLKGAVN